MLAGASCILIMPPAAMASAASTLKAGGTTPTPTPTVVTMSAFTGLQMDDGSVQFLLMDTDGQGIITYNVDGTITNSLLSA